MKKLMIAIFIAVIGIPVSAQKLLDIYKKGTVKLVPDMEYAQGNNWDIVFKTYYDTLYTQVWIIWVIWFASILRGIIKRL